MTLTRWPLVLGLFLFSVLTPYFFWQIGDDSYIYFRYVAQSASGFWGQWTPQLAPVEGYSSPLWFLLLVILELCHLPVPIASRVLGVVLCAASLLISWRLSFRLSGHRRQADLTVLIICCISGFYYWGSSALETPLYTFLYSAFAYSVLCDTRSVEKYWSSLGFYAAALSLARPEGVFLITPLLLIAFFAAPQTQKRSLHKVLSILLISVIPLSLWMIFRLNYYGAPLANTFYAKATGDFIQQISQGLLYSLPILPVCIALGIIFLTKKTPKLFLLLIMIALPSAFIVGGGGDWMFHFRLWQPILPLLIVTLIWVAADIIKRRQYLALSLLILSCLPMSLLSVRATDIVSAISFESLSPHEYQEGTMTTASIQLAEEIRHRYQTDNLTIAVNHAGALPWALNEAQFIDMVGLNDATIAQAKGVLHAKYDIDYVINSEPDLIVLNTRTQPNSDGIFYHKGYWQGEDALVDDPRFINRYQATDLIAQWQWVIPWPMSIFYNGYPQSWIVVYESKTFEKTRN